MQSISKHDTAEKKMLAYKVLKIAKLTNGKVLYGIHFSFVLTVPDDALISSDTYDYQAFIDSIWRQMLRVPPGVVVQGMQVKEIKKWPLTYQDIIEMSLDFDDYQLYLDRMAPYVGKSNRRVYTVFVGLVADDQQLTAEKLHLQGSP